MRKVTAWATTLWMILTIPATLCPQNSLDCTLSRIGDELWLDQQSLPQGITPEQVAQLYTFLSQILVGQDSTDTIADTPEAIAIHFTASEFADQPFPRGCEGFGGLTGSTNAICKWTGSGENMHCRFGTSEHYGAHQETMRLVLVRIQSDTRQTLGYLVHELSHTLGAIDGAAAPLTGEDQQATGSYDIFDAYWWFGVSGVFDLQPTGIAWDALSSQCITSRSPSVCDALARILLLPTDALNPP
jgi:hypothetical protein